ncbi:MAG: hypothetical protein J5606_09530 [Bacteroidales bacterium]|nr:hypothetical protein [Bacteroidales bacterium]
MKLLLYQTENRVLLLTEKYNSLVDENKQLKEKIAALKEEINVLNIKNKEQAENIVNYKLKSMITEKQTTKDIKLKINELVRDIDACLKMIDE